jgi:hypothetical protein
MEPTGIEPVTSCLQSELRRGPRPELAVNPGVFARPSYPATPGRTHYPAAAGSRGVAIRSDTRLLLTSNSQAYAGASLDDTRPLPVPPLLETLPPWQARLSYRPRMAPHSQHEKPMH